MTAKTSILTRTVAATVVAGMVAAAAGAASAQSYRQPSGPLGSVLGCDAPGGKQAGGAVIGALLGAVLGSNLARDDRGTAATVGAVAGAAGGSYLGCKMQRGAQPTYGQGQAYAPAQATYGRGYDRSAAGDYVAVRTVNVRAAPSTGAARVGQLQAGQGFQAVGRDGDWVVVSGGGQVGYVSAGYVQPSRGFHNADYRY